MISLSVKTTYLKRLYIITFIVKYQGFLNAIHVLFSVFIDKKWIVVNVRHVNNCVKMYKNYIGVFPVRHVVVSVDKYESLLPILKTIQVKCIQHPENTFEYFCATHECPCCILCKRNQHNECQDVEKIEEVVKTVNVSDEFVKLNSEQWSECTEIACTERTPL